MSTNQLALAVVDNFKLCLIAVSTITVLVIMAMSVLPMVLIRICYWQKGQKAESLVESA